MPNLGNQPGDTYIPEKNTYDAFQNTRLEPLLRYWGVNLLIIGGVATNVCCETTARCVHRRRVQPASVVALLFLLTAAVWWSSTLRQPVTEALGC